MLIHVELHWISNERDGIFGDAQYDWFDYHEAKIAKEANGHIPTMTDLGYEEPGILESFFICSGRALTATGQGIAQLYHDVVDADHGTAYTSNIIRETALYENTGVAHSWSGRIGEFTTDALIGAAIPGGSGVEGSRLIISSMGAGAIFGGIASTADNTFTSRFENAAFGAVAGGVGGGLYFFSSKFINFVSERGFFLAPNKSLFHTVTSPSISQCVLDGINPRHFNSNSRFGKAFYLAEIPNTTLAELSHYSAIGVDTIRYEFNRKSTRLLDLTNSRIAKKWGYTGGDISLESKNIGHLAKSLGYDAIRYKSERGTGANIAIINNFDKLLKPKFVAPVPEYRIDDLRPSYK